ncbi:MAG: GIY-YIG nuclease family protein [Nitrospinota bacterium]|nr:GIY-YIG nuclease family protein [Nitrospinota bacterium]
MAQWHLYIIRVRGGSLYTGIATDVERRFAEHVEGGKKGSKYLRARGPLTLVFQQQIGNQSQALKAETAVKNLSKPAKEQLVKGNLKLDEIFP